ncbi:MAG: LPS translocon maturation chaperone LptM [Hyphomicrobium sp.]
MMRRQSVSPALTAAALLLAALALSACGVKGPLEPPVTAQAGGEAKSADSASAGENTAAKPKPHEPFVLDGLLR